MHSLPAEANLENEKKKITMIKRVDKDNNILYTCAKCYKIHQHPQGDSNQYCSQLCIDYATLDKHHSVFTYHPEYAYYCHKCYKEHRNPSSNQGRFCSVSCARSYARTGKYKENKKNKKKKKKKNDR